MSPTRRAELRVQMEHADRALRRIAQPRRDASGAFVFVLCTLGVGVCLFLAWAIR